LWSSFKTEDLKVVPLQSGGFSVEVAQQSPRNQSPSKYILK
jgi:hypothetical protein